MSGVNVWRLINAHITKICADIKESSLFRIRSSCTYTCCTMLYCCLEVDHIQVLTQMFTSDGVIFASSLLWQSHGSKTYLARHKVVWPFKIVLQVFVMRRSMQVNFDNVL